MAQMNGTDEIWYGTVAEIWYSEAKVQKTTQFDTLLLQHQLLNSGQELLNSGQVELMLYSTVYQLI